MDSNVNITEGAGKSIDTRTNVAGDHRQVVVLGHESVIDSVAGVQATDPASNALGLIVRDPLGTLTYGLMDSSGIRVRSISDGTIGVENVTRVKNVVDGTLSTVTRVSNIVDGTLSTVTRVSNIVDGTLSLVSMVQRVNNVIDGTLSLVSMVQRVNNVIDGTLTTVTGITNTVTIHGDTAHNSPDTNSRPVKIGGTARTLGTPASNVAAGNRVSAYYDLAGRQVVTGDMIGTINVRAADGTMAIYFSPTKPNVFADINATGRVFTVSGSVSGNYPSGFTLVAPSASYNFKVFAYSLQTTGIVSEVFRFTNGGGSVTEFWRGLVTAVSTTSSPVGANLAVAPPGYIFHTGVSTTLALKTDTGSLVHYSVSFIKESA